jgi:hypothetical protein
MGLEDRPLSSKGPWSRWVPDDHDVVDHIDDRFYDQHDRFYDQHDRFYDQHDRFYDQHDRFYDQHDRWYDQHDRCIRLANQDFRHPGSPRRGAGQAACPALASRP